jgi:hypothetical protein
LEAWGDPVEIFLYGDRDTGRRWEGNRDTVKASVTTRAAIVELVEDGMRGHMDNIIPELGRLGGVEPVAEMLGQRIAARTGGET